MLAIRDKIRFVSLTKIIHGAVVDILKDCMCINTEKELKMNETYLMEFLLNRHSFQMEQFAVHFIKKFNNSSYFFPQNLNQCEPIEKNPR